MVKINISYYSRHNGRTRKKTASFYHSVIRYNAKAKESVIRTITRDQLKAISQIAHNIIKSIILLSSSERAKLKRHKSFIHLIGSKKLGFIKKKGRYFSSSACNTDTFTNSYTPFENCFSVMEKAILVPYDKYQRLLAQNKRCNK